MTFHLKLKKPITFPTKQQDSEFKIKLNGKKVYETDSIKYFGIQIDMNWISKQMINHVQIKLNKANATLSKLGYVLYIKTLRPFYYAIFGFHFCYAFFFGFKTLT